MSNGDDFEVVIIGGGQAGIAISEHLQNRGVSHIVFEKERIAEQWRSGRWDSLVANGPAWHDRFPHMDFETPPDDFAPKEVVADYLEAYAKQYSGRIETGVEVTSVSPIEGSPKFLVKTSRGEVTANHIVAATGPFQKPVIPPVVPDEANLTQIHSHHYRNPDQLPDGAILVVGAGSSGAQIATELAQAGRKVFLSIGPHERPPRSYRGRDLVWWFGVLGVWDMVTPGEGAEHVTISISGADGGRTVDFRNLAEKGVTLLGTTTGYENGYLTLASDLQNNIANGDKSYLELLERADAYIAERGLDLPQEPEAKVIGPDPDCLTNPLLRVDLEKENINSVIWATGFTQDYSWLNVDAFDSQGRPIHQRGVSPVPGVYFLGLPWLSRRGSSFIWGVWHDAKYIADQIDIQRAYAAYRPEAQTNQTAFVN